MTQLSDLLACAGFGLVSGGLSGFLGIGGGAILTPLLVFGLGLEQHRAQGISLAALLPPVGLPAVLAYRRKGVLVQVRLVLLLIVGFLAGGSGGAWIAHRVPSRELRWLFAAFLLLSAWRAVAPKGGADELPGETRDGAARLVLGLAIGALAGALSGLLGIGGGIVALPLLRRLLRIPRLEAQVTTLAMMLPPIGLPAVMVYAREQGGLPWALLGAVGGGFAVGAGAGALVAPGVSARVASRVYAAFLVLVALLLFLRR